MDSRILGALVRQVKRVDGRTDRTGRTDRPEGCSQGQTGRRTDGPDEPHGQTGGTDGRTGETDERTGGTDRRDGRTD